MLFRKFLFSFALEKYFDKKVTTVVNNSYELAKNYVQEVRNKIEADIILIAFDTNKSARFLNENSKEYLRFLKTQGFWVSAFDSKSKKDFTENQWIGKNVLLFGSEGFGLNKNTVTNSDFIFKINISKKMESLNIANSVAIVCHHINKVINNKKN